MPRKIIGEIGGFSEMTILPGWTRRSTTYDKVDLSVQLAPGVVLTYPFIAAAMTSVVGSRLTDECAKNGIMAVVPSALPISDAAKIVRDVKSQEVRRGDLEFVGDPEWVRSNLKVGDAVERYSRAGHSVIPICDDYRNLQGFFLYREGMPSDLLSLGLSDAIRTARRSRKSVANAVLPFNIRTAVKGRDYCLETDNDQRVQKAMRDSGRRYMPILDRKGAMKGLAFIYKHSGYAVGGAIHTYKWQARAEALFEAGTDVIFIDASSGTTDFQLEAVREFKRRYPDKPICAGNFAASTAPKKTRTGKVIEVPVYDTFVEAGADILKIGMGSGAACLTTDNRGVGRALLRALNDLYEARERSSVYRPFIADGGIGVVDPDNDKRAMIRRRMRQDTRSIDLSLAFADAVMMGSYFNMFEEAAGSLQTEDGVRYKENWGEGSYRAQTLARYGLREGVRRAHVEEGGYYLLPCVGRLKPGIEMTALGVAMTLSNVGAANPREYREMAILERAA